MAENKNYNSKEYELFKKEKTDTIFWVRGGNLRYGQHVFTFDKEHFFDFFADYPEKLTSEQKKIFDKECPELAELSSEDVVCEDDDKDIFGN